MSWLILGFAVGDTQRVYVVVDKHLRQTCKATPGRQEWVTVIECICVDGTNIPPLVIFKGENFMSNLIPQDALADWKFSNNSKGWSSNEHGLMWLKKCFDPNTKEKANEQVRLLICDGHDSHISAAFMQHCYDSAIAVFLLLPHSSHLIQPLDVGVFSPLKAAMKSGLNTIFRTGIARLRKVEWIENYIKARRKAIIPRNILAGWRATGLWPIDPVRILQEIEEVTTPPPPSQPFPVTPELLTSSPPDAVILHSTNASLKTKIAAAPLATPVRHHIRRLSGIVEQLLAQNVILRRENTEVRAVLAARKERESDKRKILRGRRMITTEDVVKALEETEAATKDKTKRCKQRKRKRIESDEGESSDVEGNHSDEEAPLEPREEELLDCIVVERR